MYSPTARLLAVLELLQSRHTISGSELARRLEVDTRTVRRYITLLQDMGIPVEAKRGPQGAYHLERGRRLPPFMFSDTEGVALTLGLLAIRGFHFPVDAVAIEGALAKIERVLPENLLQQVRSLQESIIFNRNPYLTTAITVKNDSIVQLSSAIQLQQRLHLRYLSWQSQESERDFDPYGIVYNEGYWYTVGYCHLRQDIRTFRLDRILSLDLYATTFEAPDDVDVLDIVISSIVSPANGYEVEALLNTSMEEAQAATAGIKAHLEPTEEGIRCRYRTLNLDWIAFMLLKADFPVSVRAPQELRDLLAHLAQRATQML